MARGRDAVTGAFGFTGRHIAERILASGRDVVTLSRRTGAGDPLAARMTVRPLDFAHPEALTAELRGVDTLYNTYWMRFPRGPAGYAGIVAESAALLAAAQGAGIRRIVHVSVVNSSPTGPTPYFQGKAQVEALIHATHLEWAIVRPTLTYGPDDILINNLAWVLRRLPIYGMPGSGNYTVQPVHVDDVARICVEAAAGASGLTMDAAGPEVLTYRQLVDLVRRAILSRSVVVAMPTLAVLWAARVLGLAVHDVVLTRDEIRELTGSVLTSSESPRGNMRISDWIPEHAATLGRSWSSELARNYRLHRR